MVQLFSADLLGPVATAPSPIPQDVGASGNGRGGIPRFSAPRNHGNWASNRARPSRLPKPPKPADATYFLDRMVPVAEEYKIRIACHPQDPGVPPEGYQGVDACWGPWMG